MPKTAFMFPTYLRSDWSAVRPALPYLFPGRDGQSPCCPEMAQRAIKRAAIDAVLATARYLHMSTRHLGRVRSPLDALGTKEGRDASG